LALKKREEPPLPKKEKQKQRTKCNYSSITTICEALKWAKEIIRDKSGTPNLDAEILIARALKKDRSYILSNPSQELDKNVTSLFEKFIQERKSGKPIAYITKQKEFYGRDYYVDERVLVPRPETEELAELSIKYLKQNPDIKTIIDVGTGSGCIAITLALELPDRNIIATDISPNALEVAKKNITCHCEEPLRGDEAIWEGASKGSYKIWACRADLLNYSTDTLHSYSLPTAIIANLPYIPINRPDLVDTTVKTHEPSLALFSGIDGLDHYKRLFKQIQEQNFNLQFMALEIMPGQESIINHFPILPGTIQKGLAGLTRFAVFKSST
jgi:release factor glutamine methyltransferase